MPLVDPRKQGGLVTVSPEAKPQVPVNVITITDKAYKDVAVDNRWTPRHSLLQHVEGASWIIDWYSQILDTDSQLTGQQTTTSAVFQQYNKVEKLELKVTSPLSESQDADTKVISYAGTALVYTGVIPNEGDMFTADIGDGQIAVFKILTTVKKSVFKKSAYEISYTITTDDPVFIKDLEAKTINRYAYRKDFIDHGQDPLVITHDNRILEELQHSYQALAKQYFPRFFNKEFMTFTVPGQSNVTYDPYFTDFLVKMFDNDDSIVLQEVRRMNVSDDAAYTQNNFWTALSNRDANYLRTGFTQSGLISTKTFTNDPFFNTIRYSGISLCVYPLDPVLGINGLERSDVKSISGYIQKVPSNYSAFNAASSCEDEDDDDSPFAGYSGSGSGSGVGNLSGTISDDFAASKNLAALDKAKKIKQIYPVLVDNYYVLSSQFYKQTNKQSILEDMVSKFLFGREVDLVSLSQTAKNFMQWGLLEQFYYTPILLILIRGGIRTYRG